MAASQHTENYNLPIFEPDDIPQWLGDSDSWNSTMKALDTAIHEAAQGGGGGTPINVVQNTGDSVTDVMSQAAVTNAIPQVLQSTGDSQTATMSQDAITKALGGGLNISRVNTILSTRAEVTSLSEQEIVPSQNIDKNSLITFIFTTTGTTNATGDNSLYIKVKRSDLVTFPIRCKANATDLTLTIPVEANQSYKIIANKTNNAGNYSITRIDAIVVS